MKALPEPKETEAQRKAKEFIKTKRMQPEQEKKEFKLKRFQQVAPRTDTHAKKNVFKQAAANAGAPDVALPA